MRRLEGRLLRVALAVLGGDRATAEEAVVDALASVLVRLDRFEPAEGFEGYAVRATRNRAVDLRRERASSATWRVDREPGPDGRGRGGAAGHPADRLAAPQDPERLVEAREQGRLLHEHLERLGEPGGSALRMLYLEQLPPGEVARRLGLSRTTLRRRVLAAKLTLAARLRRDLDPG